MSASDSFVYRGLTERGKEVTAKIRELLKQPRQPSKAWAQRILDRQREGETFPPYTIACALEVAGDGPAPYVEREPGEDDAG